MTRFTFYNVLQLPSELIDFTYIKEIIYNAADTSVILKYSDDTELDLGSVDPGQARDIIGATINNEGELIFSFDDGDTINVGYVLSEHTASVLYQDGVGLLVNEDGTYRDLIAQGEDISIIEENESFVLNANLPIIPEDEEKLDYIQRSSSYAALTDNRVLNSGPANTWNIRPIDTVQENSLDLVLNSDGSFLLPSGYYYISAYSPVNQSHTGKLSIRNIDLGFNFHESPTAYSNSTHESGYKINGYVHLTQDTTLGICHYSTTNSITLGSAGYNNFSKIRVDIWRVSDNDDLDGLVRYQDLITTHPIKLLEGRDRFVITNESDTSDVGIQSHRAFHKELVLSDMEENYSSYELHFNRTITSSSESIRSLRNDEFAINEGRYYFELSISAESSNGINLTIIDDNNVFLINEESTCETHHKFNGMLLAMSDTNLIFRIDGKNNTQFSIFAEEDDVIASIKMWDISNIINPDQEWNDLFDITTIVQGTPSLPGDGRGVYVDDQYVYLAHYSGNHFTVVDKSDWSVVSGTPSLVGNGFGVYADDQYVYLGHANGSFFTVVDKSDWSVVPGTPSLAGNGRGVYADDQYVYLAHNTGRNFTVVDKSDWSIVSGTPSLAGNGRGVYADDQYVYLAHYNGNYFTVVDKSDWSIVSGTPSLAGNGVGVYADDQYVYLAHYNGNYFTVVDKSDWSIVSGTPSLSGVGVGVYADDQYVYLGHANGSFFTVVDKLDWSAVSGTPSLSGSGQGVYADDQYVYLAHVIAPFFTSMEKKKHL